MRNQVSHDAAPPKGRSSSTGGVDDLPVGARRRVYRDGFWALLLVLDYACGIGTRPHSWAAVFGGGPIW